MRPARLCRESAAPIWFGRAPFRPFSRPQPAQTAAKVRGFSQTAPGSTAETNSALEEDRIRSYGDLRLIQKPKDSAIFSV